ncbi:sex-determining region Y protein-like, partial [Zootermopsis nevadensis]|uniref:sex-determining region Y protein-like n=1 Tax=Zootermopsis nevadensis TaxID=136037 RepID=UPI000B8E93BA
MIFSNEWRKELAALYPADSNNQISVRLGCMWRAIEGVHKDEYFARARQAAAEHKRKYPDYVYIPQEARMQKRLREQACDKKLRRTRRQSVKRRLMTAQTSSARPLP